MPSHVDGSLLKGRAREEWVKPSEGRGFFSDKSGGLAVTPPDAFSAKNPISHTFSRFHRKKC